ncbi:MAG: hypothetical protein JXQ73_18910 [Phycisphaerae bacterium]|nr:hypothetical protein [Phycisphaerae bacterium]
MKASFRGKQPVHPGEGVGDLRLGMTPAEARALLGAGEKIGKGDSFCRGQVMVEYRKGRVAFIEVSEGGRVQPQLFGTDVFKVRAQPLLARLKRRDATLREAEPGTSYIFPKLRLALWREADPESIREDVQHLDLNDPDDRASKRILEADIRRFQFFQTVAIFEPGYFAEPKRRPKKAATESPFSPMLQGVIKLSRKRNEDVVTSLERIASHPRDWKGCVVREAREYLDRLRKKR